MELRDYQSDNYGSNHSELPSDASSARQIGSRYFFDAKPCPSGHVEARYTKGGTCVLCTRINSAKARGADLSTVSANVKANLARSKSIKKGDTTYVPSKPCNNGHLLRYTASTNCVQCDRDTIERQKEMRRESRIKKLYGMDFKSVDVMLKSQGNKCPICNLKLSKKKLHIDHCHTSGKVRGLLCQMCNQAIGLLRENPKIIRSAAEYVENAN